MDDGPHSTTLKEKKLFKKLCRSAKLPNRLGDKYKMFKESPDRHPEVSQLSSSEGRGQDAAFGLQHPHHFRPEQCSSMGLQSRIF